MISVYFSLLFPEHINSTYEVGFRKTPIMTMECLTEVWKNCLVGHDIVPTFLE